MYLVVQGWQMVPKANTFSAKPLELNFKARVYNPISVLVTFQFWLHFNGCTCGYLGFDNYMLCGNNTKCTPGLTKYIK